MNFSRWLKRFGISVSVLGVVTLMFVAYQLWGTSLQYNQAQGELADDFSSLLDQASQITGDTAEGSGSQGRQTSGRQTAQADSLIELGNSDISLSPDFFGVVSLGGSDAAAAASSQGATSSAQETGQKTAQAASLAPSQVAPQQNLPAVSEDSDALLVSSTTRLPREVIETSNLAFTSGADELIPLLHVERGEALARIQIPAIGMDEIIVEGVGKVELRKGPAHYNWTPMPGQPGNVGLGGHRTTYGAPFGQIGNLRPGDEVFISTVQGEFTYVVIPQADLTSGYRIVKPDRIDVLYDTGENLLTLTTCHPRYSSRQRLVVQAKLVGDPVVPLRQQTSFSQAVPTELASEDFTPEALAAARDSDAEETTEAALPAETDMQTGAESGSASSTAGNTATGTDAAAETPASQASQNPATPASENLLAETPAANNPASPAANTPTNTGSENLDRALGGDGNAIPSAVLWLIATAALWAGVWVVGSRWRRYPAIAIGIVPVLACLFVAFSYLDRALPSY